MPTLYVHIKMFLVNYRHFVTVWLEWQHLVWNNQCKCFCVGRNTFSEICLYLDINNSGFEIFFVFSHIDRERRVKCFIVARCYVELFINSSIPKNLTPNNAVSPYTLEDVWLENDKLLSTAGYRSESSVT